MPKSIVFCADGTWNGPGEDVDTETPGEPTNVYKLYTNLAGKPSPDAPNRREEKQKATADDAQIAKYLNGVGDSENFLKKVLGGVLGAGLIARILRGYTFLSRHYQPGDRLYLIGFSRGAYTARALAGLVARMGLLAPDHDFDDRISIYRKAAAVWFNDRRARVEAMDGNLLAAFQAMVIDLPQFFFLRVPKRIAVKEIHAVAVFDTVGSLGIPIYTEERIPADAFRFADTELSPKVRHGIHFVAADERRSDFSPTLWTGAHPGVEQWLYPGAHADVGGGYPLARGESDLSDCALIAMQKRLQDLGLLFLDDPPYPGPGDALGPAHRPWLEHIFNARPTGDRRMVAGLARSACLERRIEGPDCIPFVGAPRAPYAPFFLKDAVPAE